MKVDFNAVVLDFWGEPLKMPPKKAGEQPSDATLGGLCIQVLLADIPGEQVAGEEKFKRYELASAIKKNIKTITAEQVALLKELIGKGYNTAAVGPLYKMLEGD